MASRKVVKKLDAAYCGKCGDSLPECRCPAVSRRKSVKRKTSKPRRSVVTADYIGGNPSLPVSKEILADANWPHTEAGHATITNLDTAIIADLFRIPMWLLGYPYAPIARSAQQLKALAGPGPYRCNACSATYTFYHPPCKPRL
jgi:hypothetical protein